MTILMTAEALAADLAGAQVDPNEAQKALAYLRSKGESKALFTYLQAVVNNGSAVIRSTRTIDYYRDLLVSCQRHLRPLQNDYEQMLATFAWSLRLLRYYRAVPWASQEKATQQREQPVSLANKPDPSLRLAEPVLPAVGETFHAKVLELDDDVVMLELPGFSEAQAVGLIKMSVANRPKYRIGNVARVAVLGVRTLKSGRIVVDLNPAPQKKV
ncbi:hypothetical protein OSCT_0076 [Oscillochloris trichoides DG-6]|uniref:Uncharacterized protein n=1 Tax=Oscillochloris trichoides DG-6 TaxID=765420 RepID=E1I9S5_9CHLR|nr:hypothetical protein [Oscillochloris trichoides]EFO82077.1 hypothetical protein OSCT_0076 [Oscillochloris trichoides DG-6]